MLVLVLLGSVQAPGLKEWTCYISWLDVVKGD